MRNWWSKSVSLSVKQGVLTCWTLIAKQSNADVMATFSASCYNETIVSGSQSMKNMSVSNLTTLENEKDLIWSASAL